MNRTTEASPAKTRFLHEAFDIHSLADEIRVDALCGDLLQLFLSYLKQDKGLSPLAAGALAQAADYFLRDFVIADRQENIFELRPGRVRQFSGNWYIVKNLEPNLDELGSILQGVEAFYRFCRATQRVSEAISQTVAEECRDLEYYAQRIETFWAIEGDGYERWERECSLRDLPH